MNLKLKPETHQIMMAGGGVRMLSRFEVPPARYQLRIGVHESSGAAVGSVPFDLDVPDYSKAALSMSGLVITSTAAPRLVTVKPDPVLKDVLPLPPVATRAFAATETLSVFAEIYDRSSPSPHDVDVTVSVVPKAGGAAVFSSTEARQVPASGSTRTVGHKIEIPLKDLPGGDYVLRVDAKSRAGNVTAEREIPFSVRAVAPALTGIL
jgi:hypothetical protein